MKAMDLHKHLLNQTAHANIEWFIEEQQQHDGSQSMMAGESSC
jgi:hypothetical protein